MSRERWMAPCSWVGVLPDGPFPGYVQLVGESADAITFFVGSILFTAGGGCKATGSVRTALLRWRTRGMVGRHRAVRRHAVLQLDVPGDGHRLTSPEYDRLVWRPDWRGSICFLISGAIAYRASVGVTDGCRCAAA